MSKEQKQHFWIPDTEVKPVEKILRGQTKPQNVVFSEHGEKLSRGLQSIRETLEKNKADDSLINTETRVFKVKLCDDEKIQSKEDLFRNTGLTLNAVQNKTDAVVSSTEQQLKNLQKKVGTYTRNGEDKTYFDYIESFSPFSGKEKNSMSLNQKVYQKTAPQNVDVQIMFIPNLSEEDYKKVVPAVVQKIKDTGGAIQQEPYRLSDYTPVIRAIIPSSTLTKYENDSAVYRMEETVFFSTNADTSAGSVPLTAKLDESINIDLLPIIAILDSGIQFPPVLNKLLIQKWKPADSQGGNSDHGTKVAGKACFSDLKKQTTSGVLKPRARIIDCNILDGSVPENVLIHRIQSAVENFHDTAQIYNLSANATVPIEGDVMSIIGFELDALQLKYNIQLVVSAGNHMLWKTQTSLDDIIQDDDSRIAAPADSEFSIAVGSIVSENHNGSLSWKDSPAPYSRIGPGFSGSIKPDISAYGGDIINNSGTPTVPLDTGSAVLHKDGFMTVDAGTSFTAPVVSGDIAEIMGMLPIKNVLLAKALLFHTALPVWDTDTSSPEEISGYHMLYGRGISNPEEALYSTETKVTFLRTGSISRTKKERINIYMPELLAEQSGLDIARVTTTCVSSPFVDRAKGSEYLDAYIRTSLKKATSKTGLSPAPVEQKDIHKEWHTCYQTSNIFSRFKSGDWQIWLEAFARWNKKDNDIPYALVVTIEDLSGTLDIYNEIQAQNRYQLLNEIRIPVENQNK